jgi:L-phenylalanine/L-methionine N-acetyltransferase
MLNDPLSSEPAKPKAAAVAGLVIRAREPGDWREFAELLQLPKVRWGTLRLPFASKEQYRKWLESPPEGMTGIVAELDGRIVGCADVTRDKGRRSHVGVIGISVHDDFHGRRIGSAMMAALIEVADDWLDLKCLELTVQTDNAPAIRLYRKFGFEVEGTLRANSFRGGAYVDAHVMARIKASAVARQEPSQRTADLSAGSAMP